MATVALGRHLVGGGHPVFVIGEIGINHNGSLDIVKALIDVAVEAGCHAVKLQKRDVETVYTVAELAQKRAFDASFLEHVRARANLDGVKRRVLPESSMARLWMDPADTTNGDLKYALEFDLKEYDLIERYCQEKGILWFGSAWDGLSAHFLNGFDVPCHKIASACLTHKDLLIRVRGNRKPVILSTGGSTMDQVKSAVNVLGTDDLIILHCVANYPCKDEEVNLSVIETLRTEFPGVPIGYSGHEQGIDPSLVAVSMGACVIERHITLDCSMPGSDQKASLDPEGLQMLVDVIHDLENRRVSIDDVVQPERIALLKGDGIKRVLPSEVPVMQKLRRVTDF